MHRVVRIIFQGSTSQKSPPRIMWSTHLTSITPNASIQDHSDMAPSCPAIMPQQARDLWAWGSRECDQSFVPLFKPREILEYLHMFWRSIAMPNIKLPEASPPTQPPISCHNHAATWLTIYPLNTLIRHPPKL